MIDPEEFEAWRANPITERLMAYCAEKAAEAKQRWMDLSWDGGKVNECLLADLKATALIATDIVTLTAEDLEPDEERNG